MILKFSSEFILISCVWYSFVNLYELDINDILDENLMPANLLFLDGPLLNDTLEVKTMNTPIDDRKDTLVDAGFNKAFSTMGFHRKMINEYMCTNFIAEQILVETTPSIAKKLQKRNGVADVNATNTWVGRSSGSPFVKSDIKENMLFDPGSTGYKNWLSKTTTLEDIYKNYAVKPQTNLRQGEIQRYDTDEDYEEGDVHGYIIHKPLGHNLHNMHVMSGGHYDHSADISGGYSHHTPAAGSKYGTDSYFTIPFQSL